jgi:dihydrofolate reductase
MSNLVYWMSTSLDGFVETRDGTIDFSAPDAALFRFHTDYARTLGAFLHGRRTYELMSAYWPTADANPSAPEGHAEFARIWKRTPKVVFSKTLRSVEHNSRLAGEDVAAEVARLKRDVDGDLAVGGAILGASLMRLGLIDEYRIFVCPVVLGGGKPYFPSLERAVDVRLLETRTFPSGVLLLRYGRGGG